MDFDLTFFSQYLYDYSFITASDKIPSNTD